MSQATDRYRHVSFQGAPTPRVLTDSTNRLSRLPRQAPSPSIFATQHPVRPPVVSPADRLLLDEIFRKAQLNCASYRPTALGRRVPACLRALGARSPAEALRQLELHPESLESAVNALLIGVTAFFRDTPVFNHLRNTAIPDLLRTTPAPRVLSVGCSDGAELYSLAMIVADAGARGEFRGIDCRRRPIERAQSGRYPLSNVLSLPADLVERHFVRQDGGVQVREHLRASCQFLMADALFHLPAPPYDLIACRNFAIYLEHPAAARLWRRLHSALRPGGLLLVGKAEHPTAGFLRAGPCLYRKAMP